MKMIRKSIYILLVVIILSSVIVPISASASANNNIAFGAANVTTSGLRIRSGPGLNHSVLTHLNQGSVVVILERTNRDWYRVNFHGTVGFVSTDFLENVRVAANFNATGRVTGSRVNVRARPNTTSSVVTVYTANTTLNIVGINNGWYKINQNGLIGYIRSDLMQKVPRVATAAATTSAPSGNVALGQQIANFAMQFRGHRYVWGGASPAGFDCSGLVTYVFRNFGIRVSRTASAQFRDNGVPVARNALQPGDLVFFSSNGQRVTHVGIYIGGNQFVHASGVRVGVTVSRLDSAFYTPRWFGARRLV